MFFLSVGVALMGAASTATLHGVDAFAWQGQRKRPTLYCACGGHLLIGRS